MGTTQRAASKEQSHFLFMTMSVQTSMSGKKKSKPIDLFGPLSSFGIEPFMWFASTQSGSIRKLCYQTHFQK